MNGEGRTRYSDDRLDDRFLEVRGDIHDVQDGLAKVIQRLDEQDRRRDQARDEQRTERAADRRAQWSGFALLLAAIIGAAGAIIASGAHP